MSKFWSATANANRTPTRPAVLCASSKMPKSSASSSPIAAATMWADWYVQKTSRGPRKSAARNAHTVLLSVLTSKSKSVCCTDSESMSEVTVGSEQTHR